MTLSAFAWNIVRTYTLARETLLFRLPVPAGHGLQPVMYVSAADVTGTFLGTPSQAVWTARLDFLVPPGGIAKLHFGAFGGSISGLVQQSALDLYSMQIRASAFEGDLVPTRWPLRARPLWTDSLRRARGLRPAAQRRELHGRVHNGRGRLGRSLLRSAHSVVCGDVTSSGTVSAPQLFASNTLIVTNTSDFSDDLFLTKNWAG